MLGSTRVVFTVQLIWFVALVPALYAGAQLAGIAGAAAAHVVVAAAIVLPLYLLELQRAGDQRGARWPTGVALPLACGACVAAVSLAAHAADLARPAGAAPCAGGAMVAALALEARRMRATVQHPPGRHAARPVTPRKEKRHPPR